MLIISGDFNMPFSTIDREAGQKIRNDIKKFNNTIN